MNPFVNKPVLNQGNIEFRQSMKKGRATLPPIINARNPDISID